MPNIFEDYWTTQDLCHIFDRSLSTIWNWRKEKGLPFNDFGTVKKEIIRFRKSAVRRWAKKKGFAFVNDPADLERKIA